MIYRDRLATAFGVALVVALMAFIFFGTRNARSEDCPPGVKACKIVILTPDEEQTLTGPNALFDAAVYANRMQFESLTKAWRDKIAQSPAGTIKADVPLPPAKPK